MKKVTNFLSNATSKVASGFKRASALGTAAICTAEASMMNVFATEGVEGPTADTDNTTMNDLMNGILGIIFTIFRYVGILLLVWAIVQIVMAFKNDDADSKQKGMVLAVIAVVLTTISLTINPILKAAGLL